MGTELSKNPVEQVDVHYLSPTQIANRPGMETTMMWDGTVLTHHGREVCKAPPCPLHSPSEHPLNRAGLSWDRDSNLMKRWDSSQNKYVIDPDDITYRRAQAEGKTLIFRNAMKCNRCSDIIESTYRHDFVSCQCGDIFVDGGFDYLRSGAKDGADFTDLSEVIG